MPLSVNARVQAAQSFVRNLGSAKEFLDRQDSASAGRRYQTLLDQLRTVRDRLRLNPAVGRPARFLEARSIQSQAVAARAMAVARAQGVPHLRELVIKPYVLLYAHGDDRVLLLALKHERELVFSP